VFFLKSNQDVDFNGDKRSNKTHASTTDNESLLAGKEAGEKAYLSYMSHTLMGNRNGLVVKAVASQATGFVKSEVAAKLVRQFPNKHRKIVGSIRQIQVH